MELKPLENKLILSMHKEEQKSNQLIIAPSMQNSSVIIANVVAVNPEISGIKPQNVVVVNKYACLEFVYENKQFFIADINDCLAVIGGFENTNEQ